MPPPPAVLPSSRASPNQYQDDLDKKKARKPLAQPTSRISAPLIISVVCFLFGVSGIFFATFALLRPPPLPVLRCGRTEDTLRTFQRLSNSHSLDVNGGAVVVERPKLLGFVGIQTGFSSANRRAALRSSWFPSDPDGILSLEQATGLAFRFVIGRTKDVNKMKVLQKEVEKYKDFMLINVEEDYLKLPYKTLAFFKAAFELFEADFYVKADDDIYLRPDRLATLLAKERTHPRTYIGCMKKGPVITDSKLKWYEKSGSLIGNEYFLHAYGPIYALSAEVVAALAIAKNDRSIWNVNTTNLSLLQFGHHKECLSSKCRAMPPLQDVRFRNLSNGFLEVCLADPSLRMFSNEDVTVGSWMLAMNVNHEDNRAICDPRCTPTSIAVWDIPKCSGLCNPAQRLRELHKMDMCSKSPTLPPEDR